MELTSLYVIKSDRENWLCDVTATYTM